MPRGNTNLRIVLDDDTNAAVRSLAEISGRSISEVVRLMCRVALDVDGKEALQRRLGVLGV